MSNVSPGQMEYKYLSGSAQISWRLCPQAPSRLCMYTYSSSQTDEARELQCQACPGCTGNNCSKEEGLIY